MLVMTLFTQAVMAAEACGLPQATPSYAFSSVSMPDCDMSDKGNQNACLMHCTADAQVPGAVHTPGPFIWGNTPVFLVPAGNEPEASAVDDAVFAVHVAGPPLIILHLALRN